jgi:hypothetical protein
VAGDEEEDRRSWKVKKRTRVVKSAPSREESV